MTMRVTKNICDNHWYWSVVIGSKNYEGSDTNQADAVRAMLLCIEALQSGVTDITDRSETTCLG
jgi:hypothetical protein